MGHRFRVFLAVAVCGMVVFSFGQGGKALGKPAKSIGRRVMSLGDSITQGAGAQGGYRALLEARLRAEGYRFEFVGSRSDNSLNLVSPHHEGHGGWSTTDIVNGRADQRSQGKLIDWLKAGQPETLLVMIGTNDNPWVPRQDWTANYEKLLDVVFRYNKDIRVVMAAIPKSNSAVTGKDWAEALCFDIVKKVVKARRAKGFAITFADPYTSFNPATDLSDDYHPNLNGYRKIANAFYAALTKG